MATAAWVYIIFWISVSCTMVRETTDASSMHANLLLFSEHTWLILLFFTTTDSFQQGRAWSDEISLPNVSDDLAHDIRNFFDTNNVKNDKYASGSEGGKAAT